MRLVSLASGLIAIACVRTTAPAQRLNSSSLTDRITIQERLLYAYAYTYDSKDCVGWSNLFAADAVLDLGRAMQATGREAIRQACIARQKEIGLDTETHHNMVNIIFEQITSRSAETRTYCILTWQKPGEPTPTIRRAFTYRDVIVKSDDGRWLFKERRAIDLSQPPK